MATPKISEKEIRIFLMDKPELNPLIGGVRWSPEEIEQAGINVVAYFNESAPATGYCYTIENFPFRYIFLIGIAGWLLRSASINQASNELSYSADGVSVQDNNKAAIFSQLGQTYWEEFKTMVYNIKMNQYTSQLFGNNSSEFNRPPSSLW